jgi:very-short-patch-repair endonuclease
MKIVTCIYCRKEYSNIRSFFAHIINHEDVFGNKNKAQTHINHFKFPNENLIECKICGLKSRSILRHISQNHNIEIETYLNTFNLNRNDLTTESFKKELSSRISGEKNPAFNHMGKFSQFSKNFIKYKDLLDGEKEEIIKKKFKEVQIIKQNNPENENTKIEYWTSKGLCLEDASIELKNRQNTFTLDKCVIKHGLDKGTDIYNNRQLNWQKKLKNKTDEEIKEINKKKALTIENFIRKYGAENGTLLYNQYYKKLKNRLNAQLNNFSKISQDLFYNILFEIKDDYEEVYFATLDRGFKNNEYFVETNYGFRYLDFFIKDIDLCIEFDGDYWHKKREELDKKREEEILEVYPNLKILHIKENEYIKNKDRVIQECLSFIKGINENKSNT